MGWILLHKEGRRPIAGGAARRAIENNHQAALEPLMSGSLLCIPVFINIRVHTNITFFYKIFCLKSLQSLFSYFTECITYITYIPTYAYARTLRENIYFNSNINSC